MRTQRKPTHPGEVLREDVIIPLDLTVGEAARRLRIEPRTFSALLNGKIPLSSEMALRIGKATRTTPESWLSMQAKLDLFLAAQTPMEVEYFEELVAA